MLDGPFCVPLTHAGRELMVSSPYSLAPIGPAMTTVSGRGLASTIFGCSSPARKLVAGGGRNNTLKTRLCVSKGEADQIVNNQKASGLVRGKVKPLVQERITDDLIRRYWQDESSEGLRIEEVKVSSSDGGGETNGAGRAADGKATLTVFGVALPNNVVDFILPRGFPDSVSSDYLQFMLWQFPTSVTGWICSTLVTSSLFKAVGVGVEGGYAAAATATIKWVTKDGLGALGLILIGGRFGTIFDEDPKQWRLYADFVGSAGSVLELCTPLAPDQFLLLGSFGYLLKAIARGLKDPSSRVIQNHFARSENVGDISAKDEVWQVSAKLVGLAIAVLLLGAPGWNSSYWKLVLVWTSLRSIHLWLRYQSLAGVQFPTINYKRAKLLVECHLEGQTMPDCKACNKKENILVWWQLVSPRVLVGCSLKDELESSPSGLEAWQVEELLNIYTSEDYVLVLRPNPTSGAEAHILPKEGVTSLGLLRGLWQAYWLLLPSNLDRSTSSIPNSWKSTDGLGTSNRIGDLRSQLEALRGSVEALNRRFDSFLSELKEAGWDLDKVILKVPRDAPSIIV